MLNSQLLLRSKFALLKQAIDVQQVYSKNKPSYYLPEHLRANPMNLAEATNLANGMAAVAPHNALDNTRLDLNGLQVQGYGSRVQNNKRLTSLGRWHHQFAGDELEGALPDRTQGLGDLYMPFSDVVSVPSGNAGTAMHELGHAIDFNAFPHDSSLRRGIAAIYRNRAPTLWTEHAAWRKGQNAVRDAAAQDKLELQMAHKALSEGASAKRVGLGSYWGGAVGGAAGAGVGLAGSIGLMLAMENQGMRARGLGRLVPMAAIGGGVLGAMGGTALGAYMGRNPVDPDKITGQLARAIAKKRGISPNEAVDLVNAALATQKAKKPAKQPARKSDKQFALKQALFDDKPLGLDNPATNVPPPSTQPATQPAPQPMQQYTLANTFANMVRTNNQPKSPPAQSLPSAPASAPSTPTPAAAGGAPSAGNAWRGAQAPPASPSSSDMTGTMSGSPPEPMLQNTLARTFANMVRTNNQPKSAPSQEAQAPPAAVKPAPVTNTTIKNHPSFFKEYGNAMGNNARNVLGAVNTAHSYLPVGTVLSNATDAVGSTAVSHVHGTLAPPMLRKAVTNLPDGNTMKELVNRLGHRADASEQDAAQQLWRAVTPYSAESQKPYVSADSQVLAGLQADDNNPITKSIGGWSDFGTRMISGLAAGGPVAKAIGGAGKGVQLANGAVNLAGGAVDGYNGANAMKDYEAGDTNALSIARVPESATPAAPSTPAAPISEEAANNLIAAKPSEHRGLAQAAAAPIIEGGPEAIQSATRGMQDTAKGVMGNPETAKAVTESVTTGKLAPNLFDTGWQSLTEMTQDPQKAVDMFKNMSFPEQLGLAVGLGMAGLGLLAYFGSEEGGLGGALMALLGLGVAGGIGANALTGGVVGNEIANSTLGKAIGGSELGKAIGGMFGGTTPAAKPGATSATKPAGKDDWTWKGTFAKWQSDSAMQDRVRPRVVQGFIAEGLTQAEAERETNRAMSPAESGTRTPTAATPAAKPGATSAKPNPAATKFLDDLLARPEFRKVKGGLDMYGQLKRYAPLYDAAKPNNGYTGGIRVQLARYGIKDPAQADAVIANFRERTGY